MILNINVSSASTIFYRLPFIGAQDVIGINTNGLTNISAAVLSDVTAYLTGESIGITSVTYDNLSGIASVTTGGSHGLLVGNQIQIGGLAEDILNGKFVVDTVYSPTSLALNVGVGTTVIAPTGNGLIYPAGITAQADTIDFADEAASARLVPQYAGITTTISSSIN